jgi:hypothetical protein
LAYGNLDMLGAEGSLAWVTPADQAGAQHSQSPGTAEDGAVMTYSAPFMLTKASQFRTAEHGRDPDLSSRNSIPEAALLVIFAQYLAGLSVDEMQPGASWAKLRRLYRVEGLKVRRRSVGCARRRHGPHSSESEAGYSKSRTGLDFRPA